MAATAALRSGAGLVRVASPASVQPQVAVLNPCYTTIPLAENAGQMDSKAAAELQSHLSDNDIVGFGPGVGISSGVRDIALSLLATDGLKLVIDADGLNVLAKLSGPGGWMTKKTADVVLTPHPGEMTRLWKSVFRESMPDDRTECAAKMAEKTKTIVVLKGPGTVVTDGQQVYVNSSGNPGMATAGSGDVLTGVIAALAGQGLSLFDAAVLGVYVHGLAGNIAAAIHGHVSLIATDIIDNLSGAFGQVVEW